MAAFAQHLVVLGKLVTWRDRLSGILSLGAAPPVIALALRAMLRAGAFSLFARFLAGR